MTEDEASFEDFYRATASRLIGQIALLTGDREEARDCVHEAMEKAWLRWPQVRGMRDPESWVRTVAWRLGISRWRRVRTGARLMAAQRPQQSTDDHAGSVADAEALSAALRRLPADQRLALVLFHVCDLDVATVARETRSSVSATKSRLARGRQALTAILGDAALADDTPAPPPRRFPAAAPSTYRPPSDPPAVQFWNEVTR